MQVMIPDAEVGIGIQVRGLNSVLGIGSPIDANYHWDFGDPTGAYDASNGFNASHIYTTAGKYNLTLTITNDLGYTSTVSAPITIAAGHPPGDLCRLRPRQRQQLRLERRPAGSNRPQGQPVAGQQHRSVFRPRRNLRPHPGVQAELLRRARRCLRHRGRPHHQLQQPRRRVRDLLHQQLLGHR